MLSFTLILLFCVFFFNQKLKRYFLVAKKSSRERSELELTQVLMSFGAEGVYLMGFCLMAAQPLLMGTFTDV